MKKTITSLLFLAITICASAQANGDYQSIGNVSLNTISNWQVYSGNSKAWEAASIAPDKAIFENGNTITILPNHNWLKLSSKKPFTLKEGVTLINKGGINNFFDRNSLVINGTYIHNTGMRDTLQKVFFGIDTTTGLGSKSTIIIRGSKNYTSTSSWIGWCLEGRTFNELFFDTDDPATIASGGVSTGKFLVNGKFSVSNWDIYLKTPELIICTGEMVINAPGSIRVNNLTIEKNGKLTINAGAKLSTSADGTLTINGVLNNKSTEPISGDGEIIIKN